MDPSSSNRTPFEGAETSKLSVEARIADAGRGTSYSAGAVVFAVLGLLMLGAVVVSVTLRILGLG